MSNYSGIAQGLMNAFTMHQQQKKENKLEAKEAEQQTYDRNRQAVADQQNAGLYEDQRKNSQQNSAINGVRIEGLNRENTEAKRQQYLTDRLIEAQRFAGMNDDEGLFSSYSDLINNQTLGDPKTGVYSYKVEKQPDGTGSINAYDRNTGALVTTTAKGVTRDHILKTIYSQIKPIESIENDQKSAAELAKENRALAVDDYKWGRNFQGDITKLGITNRNAWGLAEYNQQQANGREQMKQDGANYRNASPSSGGKAGANAIPGFTWGGGVPSSGDMARLTFQLESNGQHFDANGQPLRSYDPKSSARGGGQFIQSTRDLMIKKYNIDPWSSADSALKATQLYQEDNTRLLNNDPKAGFVAHYAGPGAVQQWQAQAAKNDGSWQAWEKYIPAKYQQRAAQYDQVFSAQSPARSNQASDRDSALIPSTVAPLAKRIVESFKDYKGQDGNPLLNEVQVGGQLGNAANLLTKAYQSKNMQQKTQLLNDAGDIIDSIYVNTGMSPQQIRDARNSHIAQMAGEGDNIGGVYKKLGLREQQQIDTRTQQQASVSGVTNNPSFAREDKSTPPAQAKSIGKANLASTKAQVVDTQKLVTYIDGAPKPNGMTTENIQREAQMIQQALATNPPAASKAKLQARLSRLEPFMATNTGSVPSVVKGAKSVGSTIKSGFTMKLPTTGEIKARNAAEAERRKAREKKQLDAAVSLGLTMR